MLKVGKTKTLPMAQRTQRLSAFNKVTALICFADQENLFFEIKGGEFLSCSCTYQDSLSFPHAHTNMNETKWKGSRLKKRLTESYLKVSYRIIKTTLHSQGKVATFSKSNRPAIRANPC